MRVYFSFGSPQFFASLLLVAFLSQSLWLTFHRSPGSEQARYGRIGAELYDPVKAETYLPTIRDGIMVYRLAGAPGAFRRMSLGAELSAYGADARPPARLNRGNERITEQLSRLVFLAFGLWLGGAIWWVTRRLYGNAGGYVALSLYAFSPLLVAASAFARPEVITAWGTFGLIFTAIGLGHTLYAPWRKWLPRLTILGVAIAVTVGSGFSWWVMVPVGLGFMLYLVPGRRLAALGSTAAGCLLAVVILWAAYGFRAFLLGFRLFPAIAGSLPRFIALGHTASSVSSQPPSFQLVPSVAVGMLLVISLATYALWPRTRYFGNSAPLLAALVLASFARDNSTLGAWVIVLPFLFVFIAGICADLLETAHRRMVLLVVGALITANAILCVFSIPQIYRV